MRRFFLIIAAITMAGGLHAQGTGDTGIRLITEYENTTEAISEIMGALSDMGIGIESVDKELGIINTAIISTERETTTIMARFLVQERRDTVFVTATGSGNAGVSPTLARYSSGTTDLQVTRKGQKGSILLSQWETLERIAMQIPHTKVIYINSKETGKGK